MSNQNKCPHPQCQKMKPRDRYACAPHWFSLPTDIKNQIWAGYKSSATAWLAADAKAQEHWARQMARTRNPKKDVCGCGHLREQHIYEEGACRPGFVCPSACSHFKAKA